MKRYMALGAALVALGAGGAALGQKAAAGGAAAAQAEGGLSVLPALVEHDTRPGPLGTYTVANRSAAPLTVKVTPRPWVQSAAGNVSVNRGTTLPGVSVSESTFTLAPGAERVIVATLDSSPAAGSLYGALEVVGLPADVATRKGLVVGYRVLGTIRVLPSAPKVSLVASAPRKIKGVTVIPVTNAGNTIDRVTGTLSVKGAAGTSKPTVPAVRILPGKRVNLPLGRLSRGSYTATLRLTQRGQTALTVSRKLRVR